jgi:DNA-damage-inducible protein J
MNKSAYVSVRIRPELKESSEKILNELGITPTEAITLFYSQIKLRKGLPFSVDIPNELTAKVLNEMDAGVNIHTAASVDDLMAAIEG